MPFVGKLNDVCAAGGSTLSMRVVFLLPYTPLGRAYEPWFVVGMVFSASSAAAGSAGWLMNAEGSVGGGCPTSSMGAAFRVVTLNVIITTEVMPCAMEKPGDLFAGTELFMIVLIGACHGDGTLPSAEAKAEP